MIPSAPGTLLKKECSPFDQKCKDKLRMSAFRKKKPKFKGHKLPPAGNGDTVEHKPKKEEGRDFQYSVTYPGGETRLLREKRDTSISLQEQIKKARKEALRVRAEKKAD